LLFITWITDTGLISPAVFWKLKLSPRISPNKTVEGPLGTILLCGCGLCPAGIFFRYSICLLWYWLLGSLVGQVGDLENHDQKVGRSKRLWKNLSDRGVVRAFCQLDFSLLPVLLLYNTLI
jgi:hypothetical protein